MNTEKNGTIILGIEGTAWNLSAALINEKEVLAETESTYIPPSGGIHPREAAQHHTQNIHKVLSELMDEGGKSSITLADVDGIAFSQGPGMGPCLRTVATAARALSLTLDVPLLGVNHCVSHVEVGRWQCNVDDPVTLYVSGANSQVLAYRTRRYRIFGETLDISVGNALDKFARHAGLQHPGGPKVEALAKDADKYIPLPYVVKGMDFSFSGLMTATKELLNKSTMENACHSMQETAFAMLVEVTERALAHCEKDQVLLAGGVGANKRLREMLEIMCEERGATFHVPEFRFMKDNGAMIAYTGLLMLQSGDITPVEKSHVNPDYRPNEVDITWR